MSMWRHLTRRLSKPAASCLAIALRIEHVVRRGKNNGSRVSVPSRIGVRLCAREFCIRLKVKLANAICT